MKTLIFNGSPRKNGDTAALISALTAAIPGEHTVIRAYDAPVSPCIDCRACRTHPGCAIDDAMQPIYAAIEEADNIVIASPIYFSELTGRLLDLASRLQAYFSARHFRKTEPIIKPKKGAVILVGGGDGDPLRAYGTACSLLHHMRCTEIHPPVVSHDTDALPAGQDRQALEAVAATAAFLSH